MKRLLLSALLIACLATLALARTPIAHASPSDDTTSCQVTYNVDADFRTGFLAEIFITNTGTTTINGWTLQFTFPGNQQITSFFNGGFTQSGQNVTVVNRVYNGVITPGKTLSPNSGFVASYSGVNTNPTSFTLNGTTCSIG